MKEESKIIKYLSKLWNLPDKAIYGFAEWVEKMVEKKSLEDRVICNVPFTNAKDGMMLVKPCNTSHHVDTDCYCPTEKYNSCKYREEYEKTKS